jgi:hypothetical protein
LKCSVVIKRLGYDAVRRLDNLRYRARRLFVVSGRCLSDMNNSSDAIGLVEMRAQHSTAKIQKAKLARPKTKFNRAVEFCLDRLTGSDIIKPKG